MKRRSDIIRSLVAGVILLAGFAWIGRSYLNRLPDVGECITRDTGPDLAGFLVIEKEGSERVMLRYDRTQVAGKTYYELVKETPTHYKIIECEENQREFAPKEEIMELLQDIGLDEDYKRVKESL